MKSSIKEDEESQILAVARELTALMIDRDTEALDTLLDPDFTLTHITGYVQPKQEWYDEIESENMKYYSYTEVSHSITLDGEKATFVGRNILDARIWGTRNKWRLQQKMLLEKRSGKWIILSSLATTF